jgi:hypothetical protein
LEEGAEGEEALIEGAHHVGVGEGGFGRDFAVCMLVTGREDVRVRTLGWVVRHLLAMWVLGRSRGIHRRSPHRRKGLRGLLWASLSLLVLVRLPLRHLASLARLRLLIRP